MLYCSTSISRRRRGLKSVPRSDFNYLIQRAFLSTCVGTTLVIYRSISNIHRTTATRFARYYFTNARNMRPAWFIKRQISYLQPLLIPFEHSYFKML